MKKGIIIIFSLLFLSQLSAQNYNIGIRAGLNNSKFIGPSESGVLERYSPGSGFHFGLSFQWNFTSTFGLRSEILYSQLGSDYRFEGDGYYIFDYQETRDQERVIINDHSRIEMDISNAHLSFPVTAHYKINDTYEIFGGGYFNILVSPVGTGQWFFAVDENGASTQDYSFEQAISFRYNSDVANSNASFARNILLIANGQNVDLAEPLGAYTLLPSSFNTITQNLNDTGLIESTSTEITTKKFKGLDYGLILGGNYYINRGLFVGARIEYGLHDITNTGGDYSFKTVGADGTPVFNDDYDRNLNLAISFGFKF